MHTDFSLPDKDATSYFRAVVAAQERSERVLDLTEHIIRLNPGHYSVWWVFTSYISAV